MGLRDRFIVFAWVFLFIPLISTAADFSMIDTKELRTALEGGKIFVLIDARTKDEYQEAHITGAVNIQEKDFEGASGLLPGNRNTMLVIYCNGVKCGKSKKVAVKAAAMGFTKIALYAEGFPVWEEKGLPITAGPEYGRRIDTRKLTPGDVQTLIAAGKDDYVLVDVREETEFREGHLPTAISIPVETFASKSGVLPKEKKIIVYCNTGGRSYTAYRRLIRLAYPNIYQTTLSEWKEAGMQVEK